MQRVYVDARVGFLLTTDIIENGRVIKVHKKLNLKDCDNMVGNAWLNVENKTPKSLSLHEIMEETEELDSSGNDILHRITGCNDRDKPSVTEPQRFDKNYNNRTHPSRGATLQNVLNNGEEANSPDGIYDNRNEDVLLFRGVSSLNGSKPEENVI